MDIRHDYQAYTVQATQRAMIGVVIPAMLSPITIGVIMVNRQAGDWAWLVIVFMLSWIVLGLVLGSKLLRPQLLSADEQGVRYGRKATPWLEMKKLVLQKKGLQIHIMGQSKWGSTQIYDFREDRLFAEASEELARRAERHGVEVERK